MPRKDYWKNWSSLWLFKPGLHRIRALKVKQSLAQYDVGQRYSLAVKTVGKGDGARIEVQAPFPLPAMTLRQFRGQFQLIRGEQKGSRNESKRPKIKFE